MEYEKDKEEKPRIGYKYLIYYIIYIIAGIYLRSIDINITVDIGDYGKFVPALLFSIAIVAIRWIPYLGAVGFILTLKKESLKDIILLYFIFTLIVILSTFSILYVIL